MDHDVVIIGLGLAGAVLAWTLRERGLDVVNVDAGETITSSKIAAGLMTPIAGPQLAVSWRSEAERAVAYDFYRRVEQATSARFFETRTAVRLLSGPDEVARWATKRDKTSHQQYLLSPQPDPLVAPSLALAPYGGFAMDAAQLDTRAFLTAVGQRLALITAHFDWTRDVAFEPDHVRVLDRRVRWVISCEGAAAAQNPHLSWLPMRPRKGEIITIRTARPLPPITLHKGIWVAPTRVPDEFRVGATFSGDTSSPVAPTASGRADLETRLATFWREPYTVIGQEAAVRPIVETNRLALGRHPRQPRLAIFNGLAAKGTLRAPLAAQQLAAHLLDGAPLAPTDDVARFTPRCV